MDYFHGLYSHHSITAFYLNDTFKEWVDAIEDEDLRSEYLDDLEHLRRFSVKWDEYVSNYDPTELSLMRGGMDQSYIQMIANMLVVPEIKELQDKALKANLRLREKRGIASWMPVDGYEFELSDYDEMQKEDDSALQFDCGIYHRSYPKELMSNEVYFQCEKEAYDYATENPHEVIWYGSKYSIKVHTQDYKQNKPL